VESVSFTLIDGRRFRILCVLDDFSRECLAPVGDNSLSGERVGRELERSRSASGNGFVESFNGRLRDECLNEHLFTSYRHAREIIEDWKNDYDQNRPHTSLDGLTPYEFAIRSRKDQNMNRANL